MLKTCAKFQYRLCLSVIRKDSRCNYHATKNGHNSYTEKKITTKGLCPEAYHSIYSCCLSMLYGPGSPRGKASKQNLIHCPSANNFIVLEIRQEPLTLRLRLLHIIKTIVNLVYPVALIKRRLLIKIKKVEGVCPAGHKKDEEFEFNIGNLQLTKEKIINIGYPDELCPALFDNTYPYLGYLVNRNCFPWGRSISQCPDNKANVSLITKNL